MKTRQMTKEEFEALSKDLEEVLNKHNAEIGVSSSIQLLKREEEPVISPFMTNGDNPNKTEEEN